MRVQVRARQTVSRSGFTMLEMLVAVAILGIIAAIAIPRFMVYQLRSKSAEAKTNLGGIRTAEEARYSEYGEYLAAAPEPSAIPGGTAASFDYTSSDFSRLGWLPDGNVYFSYGVAVSDDGAAYTADAGSDIDDDGIVQFWGYAKPAEDGSIVEAQVGCDTTALGGLEPLPCSPTAGRSVF